MDRFKSFGWPAYLTFSLLIIFPLLDAFLTVWPIRAGEVSWRFGAVGIFSRALMTPLFALVLAYAVALALEHRVMQRVISVFAGIGALCMLAASGFFILDAVQMRTQVQEQMKTAFDVASVVALGKITIVAIVAIVLCVAAFRSARGKTPAASRGGRQEAKIMVGKSARADNPANVPT
jgi:hypothetical protein